MKIGTLIGIISVMLGSGVQADWKKDVPITVRIVDEVGSPVERAEINVGFRQDPNARGGKDIGGQTDTNGIFCAKSWTYDEVGVSVKKDGFYSMYNHFTFTWDSKKQLKPFDPAKQPINLVLKQIKNPIPMYVKQVRLELPEYGKPLGFDFDKGDWVAPYGSGVHPDLIAYAECDTPEDVFNHNFRMTISFPNEKDGIIADGISDPVSGSELKSNHAAPQNGYESQWVQVNRRTMYKIIEYNCDSNRKYYFRIRTKLDEQGNIISAQYGKIYGDFFVLTYYLNPTPNDRNVEFDPDKNLFGGNDRFAP
jgi:hypothetical protein